VKRRSVSVNRMTALDPRAAPRLLLVVALAAACHHARSAAPRAAPVRITFVAQADSFAASAREYERLWAAEGPRIVAAMERVSGLTFVSPVWADTAIVARVLERASTSGYRDTPMELRASYPADTKRATLVHELGHRLQGGLFRRDEEEHGWLFLWIYDVWVALYGEAFATAQVQVERARGRMYPAAWDEAMALTPEQRAARWRAIRDERLPTRR
jgi:hypothetical protein